MCIHGSPVRERDFEQCLLSSFLRWEKANPGLWPLSPSGEDADHFTRIGTGEQATPIVGVGKPTGVQVVDGFAHPVGAANQQNPYLLLAGSQRVDVERQN